MKLGTKLFDEETLKKRHVKDNKTRFYRVNLPEVGEHGAGFFLNLGKRAINVFLLWKHK